MSFDYLFSHGDVYAAHSGVVIRRSICALEVMHGPTLYSTYYSHVEHNFTNGMLVEQGEYLGRISLVPNLSNCGCDWSTHNFECSTGPHLHFQLKYNGRPETLDGKIISNLRVKVGKHNHDENCNAPDHCSSAKIHGQPCATTYKDIKTGDVHCPVVKGSNFGRVIISFTNYNKKFLLPNDC